MEKYCDNQSVGIVVTNELNEILLIDRARFPFGLATPAGHIDEHGSPEQAATTELFEEVGIVLPVSALTKVIDMRRIDNKCRREKGDYHIWTVYTATTDNQPIVPSQDETKGANWYSREQLQQIANNTKRAAVGLYSGNLVFEPIWLDILKELNKY